MTIRRTADRIPVVIPFFASALPGSLILAPSRTGKTYLVSLLIKKFLASVAGSPTEVYFFDPKRGAELALGVKDLPGVHVLSPDVPGPYLQAIETIHARAEAIAAYKNSQGCTGSIADLWLTGHRGSGEYGATLIIVDEFVEQVEYEKDHDDDEAKQRKSGMRRLLQKALRRYASCGMHTILISQSARATDRNLLGAAAIDSVSLYIYGRQEKAMATALGLPILADDQEIQQLKGVFYFRGLGREVKIYAE